MGFHLKIDIPIETLSQLAKLHRKDSPDSDAIDQIRETYPWVDTLFEKLGREASELLHQYHGRVLFYSVFHDDTDEIFERAHEDVQKGEKDDEKND